MSPRLSCAVCVPGPESVPSRGKGCRAGRPSCAAGVFEQQAAEQPQTCGEPSAPHPKGLEQNADTLEMAPQTEGCSAGGPSGPERGHTDAQPSAALRSARVCLPGSPGASNSSRPPPLPLLLCNALAPRTAGGARVQPRSGHSPPRSQVGAGGVGLLGLTCLLSVESVRPWPRF